MSIPLPPSAIGRLPEIRAANLNLITAFESHPIFTSQASRRQGKIYFMWDFAMRTETMFQSILPNLPSSATTRPNPNPPPATLNEEQKEEARGDVVGRCMLLWTMITDTTGKTGMMFGEVPGQGVELGDEVQRAAATVTDVIFEREGQPAAGPISA
ncbi:hypothetical protein BDV95DRAFT_602520 [Massariosphaeria phaeospora]|uniref:Uncharacterized protein n=1 Tax=Massariosphaeria phaeospora TaxID=100035 RepID=A0A7C8MFT9_9PLEO|nr:hypothetical protein BDV95DRAFT_602520 [Massariosphaeria phaeospora]